MPSPFKPPFTSEYVRSILSYEPDTGILRWKRRADYKENWNVRWVGKEAGVITAGHRAIAINYIKYQSHNLAWFIQTGTWPSFEIDHKNGNGLDNSWVNLRECTHLQNMRNTKIRTDNTSGHKGVSWNVYHNAWRVRIHIDGKEKLVGYFKDFDEAVAARRKAALETYGEFYSD